MTNLTVKFQIIDEISAKLDELANSGESMVDALDEISYAAESAFGEVKSGSAQAAKTQDSHAQEKTIRLEIAGSGAVNVGAGTSKEEIVELLYANLKPVLMSIVHDEVFEEGDNSYDF